MPFPFENLRAYQNSLDWVESTESLCDKSKDKLTRAFVDQFQRGSVFECVPLVEILKRKKLISDTEYQKSRDQLDHLGRMLTKLVQAHE